MNTDLDDRIRVLVAQELNRSPAPPTFADLGDYHLVPTGPGEHRPSRRAVLVAFAVAGAVVATAGVVALTSDGSETPVTITPADTTAAPYRLDIVSLPTLLLDAAVYEAPAGPIEIHYVSQGGTHTLAITGPGLEPIELGTASISTAPDGTPTVGDAVIAHLVLEPGTYAIYCTIPGHRDAGERATLIVR